MRAALLDWVEFSSNNLHPSAREDWRTPFINRMLLKRMDGLVLTFFFVGFWVLFGKHEGSGEELTIEDSSEDGSGSIFPPTWTEWTPWSSCTESCGDSSLRLRSRRCLRNYPAECPGHSIQMEQCFLQPCWQKEQKIRLNSITFQWTHWDENPFKKCLVS